LLLQELKFYSESKTVDGNQTSYCTSDYVNHSTDLKITEITP